MSDISFDDFEKEVEVKAEVSNLGFLAQTNVFKPIEVARPADLDQDPAKEKFVQDLVQNLEKKAEKEIKKKIERQQGGEVEPEIEMVIPEIKVQETKPEHKQEPAETEQIEEATVESIDINEMTAESISGFTYLTPVVLYVKMEELKEDLGIPGFIDKHNKQFYLLDNKDGIILKTKNFDEKFNMFLNGETGVIK